MEQWQRDHIVNNKHELLNVTKCSNNLLALLRPHRLLDSDDLDLLETIQNGRGKRSQTDELFEILSTRTGAYEILIEALHKTNQTGPAKILLDGYKKNGKSIPSHLTIRPIPISPIVTDYKSSEGPKTDYGQVVYTNTSSKSSTTERTFIGQVTGAYEILKSNLQIDHNQSLGEGQFGCVYRAVLKQGNDDISVAVKTNRRNVPPYVLNDMVYEIKTLIHLGKHTNIVGIIGACTAEIDDGIVYIATELCDLGSLEGYLRSNQSTKGTMDRFADGNYDDVSSTIEENVTLRDMVRWAHDIACGLEYLGSKHIVHSDLATRNILLTSERTAKITDFGLSRRMYDYQNYVKTQEEPMPWRWMATESLKRGEFSGKSDVWSYGVTFWEICSMGDIPYPGLSWSVGFADELMNGLRLQRPLFANEEIYALMTQCWLTDPRSRPTSTSLKLTTLKMFNNLSGTGIGRELHEEL